MCCAEGIGAGARPSQGSPRPDPEGCGVAAAAAAETVALRERPEPGSQPGGASLRRIPAEPSPALAGRGSLLPGKRTGSAARAERAWARGALSARAPAPSAGRPSRGPCGPTARSAAPSAPHGRGGSGAGSPWGPRAQGAGSPPPGPRDRFVYKHCRARGGSRSGGGREGPSGRGPGPVGGTGRVWGGDLAEGTGRRSRCCLLSVAPWVRTFSVPGDAGWLPAADCGCWSGAPGPPPVGGRPP